MRLVFQSLDNQLLSPTIFDDVAFGPISMGCSEEEVRQRREQPILGVFPAITVSGIHHPFRFAPPAPTARKCQADCGYIQF